MKKLKNARRKLARTAAIKVINAALNNEPIDCNKGYLSMVGTELVEDALYKIKDMIEYQGWEYPLRWLLHYLEGSGEPLVVPKEVLEESENVFISAIIKDLKFEENNRGMYRDNSRFYVNSSIMYDGYGFSEKPPLFYLVGGFTFSLRKDGSIYAEDTYDWHPNKDGDFFKSPIGCRFEELFKVLSFIFRGEEWFILEKDWTSDDEGELMCSVSNKVFYDMESVGAKPFLSIIDFKSDYIIKEINRTSDNWWEYKHDKYIREKDSGSHSRAAENRATRKRGARPERKRTTL